MNPPDAPKPRAVPELEDETARRKARKKRKRLAEGGKGVTNNPVASRVEQATFGGDGGVFGGGLGGNI